MSTDHERWEELVAGYALDALEPDETAELTAHLEGCTRCQRALADHALVAAQLGALAEEDEPAPSWTSIRSAISPALPSQADRPSAEVVELAPRRARRTSLLAAAASLALLAGGGALAWQTRGGDQPTRQEAMVATCTATPSCHLIELQSRAMVVVLDGHAHLMAQQLPALSPAERYVLWQMPRKGRPTVVGVLDETSNGSIGEGHPLVLPYDDTAAFGLSVEQAVAIPDGPTRVVAVGTA